MQAKWESVTDTTDRMNVPGGWLVRETLAVDVERIDEHGDEVSRTDYNGVALLFYPDPGHAWMLT